MYTRGHAVGLHLYGVQQQAKLIYDQLWRSQSNGYLRGGKVPLKMGEALGAGAGNVLYHDLGGGYSGVYICKHGIFTICVLYLVEKVITYVIYNYI